MSKKNFIKFEKTGRYFVHGEDITKAKRVWFVLHGYGQLSQYFIKNFEHLDAKENFIIAPEGLHRFYLDGLSRRVGASWMTKEERLADIEDYIRFLDQVKSHFTIREGQEPILLGFSQGVATAMRWLAYGVHSTFKTCIFWAGSLPHDLEPSRSKNVLKDTNVHCVIGNQDPYLTEENIKRVKLHIASLHINATWHQFEGDHRIPKIALNNLITTL